MRQVEKIDDKLNNWDFPILDFYSQPLNWVTISLVSVGLFLDRAKNIWEILGIFFFTNRGQVEKVENKGY